MAYGVMIPDCYDPVFQAEQLAREQDLYMDSLPECSICEGRIYPGKAIFFLRYKRQDLTLCRNCVQEIIDSKELYFREEDLL